MADELKTNVLLVDDEARFVEILAERLRVRGFTVDTATSGEAALNFVQEKDFDAVLLDLSMPGMGGIEVLRQMKKDKARTSGHHTYWPGQHSGHGRGYERRRNGFHREAGRHKQTDRDY